MRTTVRLNEVLLRRVKTYAAEHGTTMTALIESALTERLARGSAPEGNERKPLPVFSGNGLQAGVDLHDAAALLDLMDSADA